VTLDGMVFVLVLERVAEAITWATVGFILGMLVGGGRHA